MSAAQLTFWAVTLGLSAAGTAWVYPGVRKHATSPRDCLLASFMASSLASTALGFFTSSLVNAVTTYWG